MPKNNKKEYDQQVAGTPTLKREEPPNDLSSNGSGNIDQHENSSPPQSVSSCAEKRTFDSDELTPHKKW